MKCEKCGGETSILHNGICFDCAAAEGKRTFKMDITPCKKCGKTRKPLVNGLCMECSAELEDYESIKKRLEHLLESEYIRSFDKVDSKGQYKRNIKDADMSEREKSVNENVFIGQVSGMLDTIGSMKGCTITDRLAQSAICAAEQLNGILEDRLK